MNSGKSNRRRSERIKCNTRATYKKISASELGYRSGIVNDIGIHGLLMETDEPLLVGDELEVAVDTPLTGAKLEARGKVIRIAEKENESHIRHLAGISFTGVPERKAARGSRVNIWLLCASITLGILFYLAVMEIHQGIKPDPITAEIHISSQAPVGRSMQTIPATLTGTFRGLRDDFPRIFTRNYINPSNHFCFDFVPDNIYAHGVVLTTVIWRSPEAEQQLASMAIDEEITLRGYWKEFTQGTSETPNKERIFITEQIIE